MTLNLTSQNVTSNVTLVYGGQGSSGSQVQFINQSTTVTVWLGYAPTILAGQGPSIPLLPGASITLDGTITTYGVTLGGSAMLSVVPGGVAYSSSGPFVQQLFEQTTNQNIPASTTITPILLQDVSQFQSYDLTLAVNDANQAVTGHAFAYTVTLSWYDDLTSGHPIFQEQWSPWVGNTGNAAPAIGSGPMHGLYLTVSITNTAVAAIALNYISFFGSARNVQLSDWRQNPGNAFSLNGYHIIPNAAVGIDNMLFDTGGMDNLSAGTNYACMLDLYAGPINWAIQFGANIIVTRSNIVNIGSNSVTQNSGNFNPQANSMIVLPAAAGSASNGILTLPRAACALLLNIGATGGTMEFVVTAQQGP